MCLLRTSRCASRDTSRAANESNRGNSRVRLSLPTYKPPYKRKKTLQPRTERKGGISGAQLTWLACLLRRLSSNSARWRKAGRTSGRQTRPFASEVSLTRLVRASVSSSRVLSIRSPSYLLENVYNFGPGANQSPVWLWTESVSSFKCQGQKGGLLDLETCDFKRLLSIARARQRGTTLSKTTCAHYARGGFGYPLGKPQEIRPSGNKPSLKRDASNSAAIFVVASWQPSGFFALASDSHSGQLTSLRFRASPGLPFDGPSDRHWRAAQGLACASAPLLTCACVCEKHWRKLRRHLFDGDLSGLGPFHLWKRGAQEHKWVWFFSKRAFRARKARFSKGRNKNT